MAKVRVAEVLWSGEGGGTQRSLCDLAAELDRQRFDAQFFFLRDGGQLLDRLTNMGYRSQVLGWKNGYSPVGRWRLAQALRVFSPNIIHDHLIPPLTRVCMQLGVPSARLISSEHGGVSELMQGRWKTTALWLNRLEYQRLDRVIVHSKHMAEMVETNYRVPRSNISLIYYGIDLREFSACQREHPIAAPSATSDAVYRIGYVGRIENGHKGVDFLPAAARLLLEHNCSDFEFIIAGDGPDKDKTQQLCREMRVDDKVRFLGWQSDVPSFLNTVDVLVVPSRYEPFGLVTLEALAMGLRVVAFDVGGIRESAEGCDDVRLVPPGDVAALTMAILQFKQDFGHTRSAHSRSYVERRFDRVRMAREIENEYLSVAAARDQMLRTERS